MQLTTDETKELIQLKLSDIESKYGKPVRLQVLEIMNLAESISNKTTTRYIPLADWNKYYPEPSISALRNYVARRYENGFNDVLERNGKKWYINEAAFFKWRQKKFKESKESED